MSFQAHMNTLGVLSDPVLMPPLRQKRVHNTHTTRGGVGAGEAQTDLI